MCENIAVWIYSKNMEKILFGNYLGVKCFVVYGTLKYGIGGLGSL